MDVDGSLTDGRFTLDEYGNETKTFNVKDGMGAILLHKANIKTGIITGRSSEIVKARAKQLKCDFYFDNCNDKLPMIKRIANELHIEKEEMAYFGDDVNDLDVLEFVGLSGCPRDAVPEVKSKCIFIAKHKGGYGAFREFSDYILKYEKK